MKYFPINSKYSGSFRRYQFGALQAEIRAANRCKAETMDCGGPPIRGWKVASVDIPMLFPDPRPAHRTGKSIQAVDEAEAL